MNNQEHKGAQADISQRATHLDPLLDCLFELTRQHGITTTRDSLIAGIPLEEQRLTPAMFSRAARRAGLVSRVLRKPLNELPAALLPAVLLLNGNDACLLREIDADGNYYISPAELPEAVQVLNGSELAARYSGLAIVVKPRFRFDKRVPELNKARTQHWFWHAILQGRPLYRDALIAAFFVNVFALVFPLFSMNVYDRVVPNMAFDTLWVLGLGVLLILVFDFILKLTRGYLIDLASKRVDVMLSALIMERVLGIRMEARPASVGAFAANLRAFETVRDFIASATVTTLVDVPFALLFVFVIFWISPWMVLPPLVAILLMLMLAFTVQGQMQELTETTFRASSQRNAHLVESLVGLETIKTLGAEGVLQGRWEKATLFLAQVGSRLKFLSAVTMNFAGFIQQLMSVSIIIIGVYLIKEGQTSVGGLIACTMLAGRAIAPMGAVAGLMTQFNNAKSSLDSLEGLMKMPVEREEEATFFHRTHFNGDIEFSNVSFTYPNSPLGALHNVSFRIRAGEKVAILGRVGSGKSTIQKLIMGLYQPQQGSTRIDGVDLRQIDPAELRRNVGYVSQEPVLFYGTLRQNISMGQPHVHDASIAAAADLAGLSEFVNSHPEGFDMVIGERGESLSGGQRKAITIARALLNAPPIMLLDEPTSNMDHSTEAAMKRTFEKIMPGKTMVLVTHHTALLDLADRIIVIDQGRILADGPKAEVVQALQQGKIGRAQV
ncbi:type I secretion system permease/ATPase [Vogesella alkaliphila]|uniref:ABC transporter n=1 Tax=Vogesella alkaliphila TaxID=1193621 RepID=A0ABQ2YXN4_9NEIS|nr:type I secretion system permease/ATPase [Vogesella alkaliphila]GGX98671.1 ABC transporter [Vogesella alkaliphila]